MDVVNLGEQLSRQRRVSDQMVSMHSELKGIYARRALILDVAILLASVVLSALVFVDPAILSWLPWSSAGSRVAIGIVAITTFFLSLVSAKVNWKGISESHKIAASAYAQFKLEISDRLEQKLPLTEEDFQILSVRYRQIGQNNIAIPESMFLSLKGKHLTKIEISRTLDRFPAASVRLLRFQLWLKHSRAILRQTKEFGRTTSVIEPLEDED